MDVKKYYCKKCEKESEFTECKTRANGLQSYCRDCMKKYRIDHYKKNKSQYLERNRKNRDLIKLYYYEQKLNCKCAKCGVEYPNEPYLFDFDHLEDFEKKDSVSQLLSYSINIVKKEIDKCQLLCVICHRRKTYTGVA